MKSPHTFRRTVAIPFIVGSSYIAVFVTFVYNAIAFATAGRPSFVPYEHFPLAVPLLVGAANVLNVALRERFGLAAAPAIAGAMLGIVMSLIGRFVYDLPIVFFGFSPQNEHWVHVIAAVLYATIFTATITPLTRYVSRC